MIRCLFATGLFLVLAACKSGEHQSRAALCDSSPDPASRLDAQTIHDLDVQLRQRLTDAGFTTCEWSSPRTFQLGAHPVAWYCGTIAGTEVEASINRPGERDCVLELDLRADVSGSESFITKKEAPIILFRDVVRAWFEEVAKSHARAGRALGTSASGVWLGEHR